MKLYIVLNKTLRHYVSTRPTLEDAQEMAKELSDNMGCEYVIKEVDLGEWDD